MMAEYSYESILEYIMEVSISDEAFVPLHNIPESFQKEVMMSAKMVFTHLLYTYWPTVIL